MERINFINLTNGMQAIKDYGLSDFRFIRLQSTACEQKLWEEIILSISDDFLMSVALGRDCVVYDYGANKDIPRAIWQGLEWLKYVLYLKWYNQEYTPQGRSSKSRSYFYEQYKKLSKRARTRLNYFRNYADGELRISSITDKTKKDGNLEWYVNIAKTAI